MDTPRKTVALNCVMIGPIGMTAIFSDQEALDGLFTQSSNNRRGKPKSKYHGDECSQLKTTGKRNTAQSCKWKLRSLSNKTHFFTPELERTSTINIT